MTSNPPNRTDLRAQYLARRNDIPPAERSRAEAAVTSNLQRFLAPRCDDAQSICLAAYVAVNGEVDCRAYWQSFAKICLPVVLSATQMAFYQVESGATLKPNRWRIPEPDPQQHVKCSCLDIVLMPLVAFDTRGTRLGMGGGYYDRYLASFSHMPLRVGVAFERQCHPSDLPRDIWDMPMDAVVTEDRVLEFRTTSLV